MTDYDKGTAALIADLQAAPKSYERDEILARARKLRYHDYAENAYTLPQIELYKHLMSAGLRELAENVKRGKYDQGKEESDKWAQTDEAKRVFASLLEGTGKPVTEEAAHEMMSEMFAKAKARAAQQPDATPNPDHDDADQKALRELGRVIEQIMHEHDCGGVIMLDSRKSSSWTIVFPKWGGIGIEPLTGQMRLRISNKTPELQAIANATLGFIASTRDIAGEVAYMFSSLFDQARASLRKHGSDIDHPPQGSPGHIGPSGKIKH